MPNLCNLLPSEFRAVLQTWPKVAPFLDHIEHILTMGAEEKMGRIDAGGIIATVADFESV